MSIFYCRLAMKQTMNMYQYLKQGWKQRRQESTVFRDIIFGGHHYKIGYYGNLKKLEAGDQLLKKAHITWDDELEYLIGLYSVVSEDVVHYVSDDAFLLIEDESSVLIYHHYPLYFKREANEIHICSDKRYLGEDHIYEVNAHACLRYFNNNLKTF